MKISILEAGLGAAFALVGYAVVGIAIIALGGEAMGYLFMLWLFGAAVPIAWGIWIANRNQGQLGTTIGKSLTAGACVPPIGFFILALVTAIQDSARRAEFQSLAETSLKTAHESGFPFPPRVQAVTEGDACTEDDLAPIEKFYDSQTGWVKAKFGDRIWYVRPNGEQFDRIAVRHSFSRTHIYFGKCTRTDFQKSIASGFAEAVGKRDWKTALTYCSGQIRNKGDNYLQSLFKLVVPDSSGFARSYFPPGTRAKIAVNARLPAGSTGYRTSEVGFFFTDDVIPRISKFEMPIHEN
ncbi:MAG TPA: hypothetical protein VJ835_03340 [Fimbriimonadaceae bacterium]|nr:hypothetical protein [Fimbriimonadaceae bacterium]